MQVMEPPYPAIPPGILRRMSKSVRMGVGAALELLKERQAPDGIIIGTANAGMMDCCHFLKQIIDYNEGQLTPGSFVQSTPNALAAQLSILGHNTGYNITHVHLGLAFENAMTDVGMLIHEHPGNNYLLGSVDDISPINYTINLLAGSFKHELFVPEDLYRSDSPGSIGGEGTAMFLVNGNQTDAIARVKCIDTLHSGDAALVKQRLTSFLDKNLPAGEKIDLLVSGENGDNRLTTYYENCEQILPAGTAIVRFKHMCGEYPTASAIALWLACYILQKKPIPQHMIKRKLAGNEIKNILIFNNYKGIQHSFILVKGMPSLLN